MDNIKFTIGNNTIILSETESLLLKLHYCDQLESMQIASILEISENEVEKSMRIITGKFKENVKSVLEGRRNEGIQKFFVQLKERYSIDEEKALIIFNGVCAELYGKGLLYRIVKTKGGI